MRLSKLRRMREAEERTHSFNPSFEDFQLFLQQNLQRKFQMDDPWSCVAAVYSGREISETYMGPGWFIELQKRVNKGVWLGKDLLFELNRVRRPLQESHITPRDDAERHPQSARQRGPNVDRRHARRSLLVPGG